MAELSEPERIQVDIGANIKAILEHQGYRVETASYTSRRGSAVLLVSPHDPMPGLYAVEIWKFADKPTEDERKHE